MDLFFSAYLRHNDISRGNARVSREYQEYDQAQMRNYQMRKNAVETSIVVGASTLRKLLYPGNSGKLIYLGNSEACQVCRSELLGHSFKFLFISILMSVHDASRLPPVHEASRLPPVHEASRLPPVHEASRLPPVHEASRLPPVHEASATSVHEASASVHEASRLPPVHEASASSVHKALVAVNDALVAVNDALVAVHEALASVRNTLDLVPGNVHVPGNVPVPGNVDVKDDQRESTAPLQVPSTTQRRPPTHIAEVVDAESASAVQSPKRTKDNVFPVSREFTRSSIAQRSPVGGIGQRSPVGGIGQRSPVGKKNSRGQTLEGGENTRSSIAIRSPLGSMKTNSVTSFSRGHTPVVSQNIPRISQSFQRQYYQGMLFDCNVYGVDSPTSVRFYPHPPKTISNTSHLFTIYEAGFMRPYRATFVLPELKNRGDVQMVLHMARASVKTTIPPEHLHDFKYQGLLPPLPLELDSSVLLLMIADVTKDVKKAKDAKIRSLQDIGFRMVGRIEDKLHTRESLKDLTADCALLRGYSAVIFEADLRSLLRTPGNDVRKNISLRSTRHSAPVETFAFEFE